MTTKLLYLSSLTLTIADASLGNHVIRRDPVLRNRGGEISLEDANDDTKVDAYIDQLIAEFEDGVEDTKNDGVDEAALPRSENQEIESEENEKIAKESVVMQPSSPESMEEAGVLELNDEEHKKHENTEEENKEDEGQIEMGDNVRTTFKNSTEVEEGNLKNNDSAQDREMVDKGYEASKVEASSSPEQEMTEATKSAESLAVESKRRRPPPNAVFRFLLRRGRIGHIIILFLVAVREFIDRYFPLLSTLLASMFAAIFPHREGIDFDECFVQRDLSAVNKNYAGFVSSDGSSVRGKRKRAATKKADEKAVQLLKRVGNVSSAKYRYLSPRFMQRHGLGEYEAVERSHETSTDNVYRENETSGEQVDEDDSSWVVDALTKPADEDSQGQESGSRASLEIGLSSSGEMEVGVSFTLGVAASRKKRRRTKESVIVEAIRSEPIRKQKPRSLPRVSDRDAGVMGRLRDLSANNIMSRKVSGAYPGDAVPPSDAASAVGVIDLAMKYGYGDWSDDEEEKGMIRSGKKAQTPSTNLERSTKKRKRRKRRSPILDDMDGESTDASASARLFRTGVDKVTAPMNQLNRLTVRVENQQKNVDWTRPKTEVSKSRRSRSKLVKLPMERLTGMKKTGSDEECATR